LNVTFILIGLVLLLSTFINYQLGTYMYHKCDQLTVYEDQ